MSFPNCNIYSKPDSEDEIIIIGNKVKVCRLKFNIFNNSVDESINEKFSVLTSSKSSNHLHTTHVKTIDCCIGTNTISSFTNTFNSQEIYLNKFSYGLIPSTNGLIFVYDFNKNNTVKSLRFNSECIKCKWSLPSKLNFAVALDRNLESKNLLFYDFYDIDKSTPSCGYNTELPIQDIEWIQKFDTAMLLVSHKKRFNMFDIRYKNPSLSIKTNTWDHLTFIDENTLFSTNNPFNSKFPIIQLWDLRNFNKSLVDYYPKNYIHKVETNNKEITFLNNELIDFLSIKNDISSNLNNIDEIDYFAKKITKSNLNLNFFHSIFIQNIHDYLYFNSKNIIIYTQKDSTQLHSRIMNSIFNLEFDPFVNAYIPPFINNPNTPVCCFLGNDNIENKMFQRTKSKYHDILCSSIESFDFLSHDTPELKEFWMWIVFLFEESNKKSVKYINPPENKMYSSVFNKNISQNYKGPKKIKLSNENLSEMARYYRTIKSDPSALFSSNSKDLSPSEIILRDLMVSTGINESCKIFYQVNFFPSIKPLFYNYYRSLKLSIFGCKLGNQGSNCTVDFHKKIYNMNQSKYRNVALLVFSNRITDAVNYLLLQSQKEPQDEKINSLLALFLSLNPKDIRSLETLNSCIINLKAQFKSYPYLCAIVEFYSSQDLLGFIKCSQIIDFDRIIISFLYLESDDLNKFNEHFNTKSHRNLLNKTFANNWMNVDVYLNDFLNTTGDLQTTALLSLSLYKLFGINTEAMKFYIQKYRELVNKWQLWNERCKLDLFIKKNFLDKWLNSQLYKYKELKNNMQVLCNYCYLPLSADMNNQLKNELKSMKIQLPSHTKLRLNCVSCGKPAPRCAVCQLSICSWPISLNTKLDGMKGAFCWCQKCFHTSHSDHIINWFKENKQCPVMGCSCICRI